LAIVLCSSHGTMEFYALMSRGADWHTRTGESQDDDDAEKDSTKPLQEEDKDKEAKREKPSSSHHSNSNNNHHHRSSNSLRKSKEEKKERKERREERKRTGASKEKKERKDTDGRPRKASMSSSEVTTKAGCDKSKPKSRSMAQLPDSSGRVLSLAADGDIRADGSRIARVKSDDGADDEDLELSTSW
jgi:hypothetical protein